MEQRRKYVTVNTTGCGFDPHSKKRNIYLYFIFFAPVSRHALKRKVEFYHSNAIKTHAQ